MTETLIHRARAALACLAPREAVEALVSAGVDPSLAFLAVKAAELLDR